MTLRTPASVRLTTDHEGIKEACRKSFGDCITVKISDVEFVCTAYKGGGDTFDLRELVRVMPGKPDDAQWTGEGLPPVGTVCQLKNVESGSEWREVAENGSKVTIIAHYMNAGTPLAAFTVGVIGESFTVDSATESFFEPIRTPEQIAAEAREKAINAIAEILTHDGSFFQDAERLYDAGYRKFEIVDE